MIQLYPLRYKLSAIHLKRGFTLIELAVVIVIIGILVGVVLKGVTMIENARIKAVVGQANDLATAVYSYQDKYGKLPGDDNLATNRWATTTNGNNNGRIDAAEPFLANQHLALAGFIAGTYNGTSQAIRVARYAGSVYIMSAFGAGVPAGVTPPAGLSALCSTVIDFTALPAEVAQAFDAALDDGVWNQGKVQADAVYAPDTWIANTAICL